MASHFGSSPAAPPSLLVSDPCSDMPHPPPLSASSKSAMNCCEHDWSAYYRSWSRAAGLYVEPFNDDEDDDDDDDGAPGVSPYSTRRFWSLRRKNLSLGEEEDGSLEEEEEWLCTYDDIKAFANAAFIKQGGTLVCGAGLSKVPLALANEGFAAPIFAVDRDELAVKYQKKKAAESKRAQKSVRAMYLDVSDMAEKVDDNSVQNVFDKACLDAIACDKRCTSDAFLQNYVSEVARILRPGGCFVVVSHAPEERILPLFRGRPWYVTHREVAPQPRVSESAAGATDGGEPSKLTPKTDAQAAMLACDPLHMAGNGEWPPCHVYVCRDLRDGKGIDGVRSKPYTGEPVAL